MSWLHAIIRQNVSGMVQVKTYSYMECVKELAHALSHRWKVEIPRVTDKKNCRRHRASRGHFATELLVKL